jgi:hypothetical protein
MGWEESTPLEQDQIRSQDRALDLPRPLNGNEASFLTIDDPDLILCRRDIPPAPQRKKATSWKDFIRSHRDVLRYYEREAA